MTTTPVIEFEHVDFAFGNVSVLQDVQFTLPRGQLTCIVGPNGGGKTTLLRLMLGTLRPTRGEVRIFGQKPRQARQRIGYMPQHLQYDRLFPISVGEIVLMGRLDRHRWGRYSPEDLQVARGALAETGLPELWDRPFARLSGGQRQRVLIARALACEPELLLLDEPTANVDAMAEGRLLELIQHLAERMTILMVSHDLGFVARTVHNVLCVNRTVAIHPTSAIDSQVIHDIFGPHLQIVRHDCQLHEVAPADE